MDFFTNLTAEAIATALPTLTPPQASPALINKRVVIIGGSIGGLATSASLLKAGFKDVKIIERNEVTPAGAGISLDDASVCFLKGIGALIPGKKPALQKMRFSEERLADGMTLLRQPFPYFGVLYDELKTSLSTVSGEVIINTVTEAEKLNPDDPESAWALECKDGTIHEADILIGADGGRSYIRGLVQEGEGFHKKALRYAGYSAWRGTLHESTLPDTTRAALKREFPHFSNCLYFVHGLKSTDSVEIQNEQRNSVVLYDIGDGLVNWLIYENKESPNAKDGRSTSAPSPEDIERLKNSAIEEWGETLGGVVNATENLFRTDVFDIQTPLKKLSNGNVCVIGDAAHPITPHLGKGSNLALHDSYALAHAASSSSTVTEMLTKYSNARALECRNTVLLSRFMGKLRNGIGRPEDLSPSSYAWPKTGEELIAYVNGFGLPTRTLPFGPEFKPVITFMETRVPESCRGYSLKSTIPSINITELNHISRETEDVEGLVRFYEGVLGLTRLLRPDFGFGGAWFEILAAGAGGSRIALHIIERDPLKPSPTSQQPPTSTTIPERYIRRDNHFALTVTDIETTKFKLQAHGVTFAENYVPGTGVTQLFIYDPDGNGIEIGDFDRV